MSHSLRAKIKCLRYKGIITDKDCNRLCKALDNEDVLDKIRTEISNDIHKCNNTDMTFGMQHTLDIIDKYRKVSE